jgi:hypothetical protein
MLNLNDYIDAIALAEPSRQETLLQAFAAVEVGGKPIGLEELKKLFNERAENAKKRAANAAKRAERESLNARLTELQKEGAALSFDFSALTDFVGKVAAAKGEVGLTLKDGKVTMEVFGVASTASATNGGGRPKKDAPQPFVDSNGERVTGPLTDWARANISQAELDAAPKVGGKLASGAKLVEYLKKLNYIVDSPVPTQPQGATE